MANYIHIGTKINKLTGFHPLVNTSNYATSTDMDNTGEYVVSGNPNNKNALVFQKNKGGIDFWGEISRLNVPGGNPDSFGSSVSINLPYILVGAPTRNNGSGAVYVFKLVDGNWNYYAEFYGTFDSLYGTDVELTDDGNYMFVVSPLSNQVFIYNIPSFSTNAIITNPSPFCISTESDYAVIGYPCNHITKVGGSSSSSNSSSSSGSSNSNIGSILILKLMTGTWTPIKTKQEKTINFGKSVVINSDVLACGSLSSVFIYNQNTRGTDNWGFVKSISPTKSIFTNSTFGYDLDLYNNYLLVGGMTNDSSYQFPDVMNSGHVYERDLGGTDNWGFSQFTFPITVQDIGIDTSHSSKSSSSSSRSSKSSISSSRSSSSRSSSSRSSSSSSRSSSSSSSISSSSSKSSSSKSSSSSSATSPSSSSISSSSSSISSKSSSSSSKSSSHSSRSSSRSSSSSINVDAYCIVGAGIDAFNGTYYDINVTVSPSNVSVYRLKTNSEYKNYWMAAFPLDWCSTNTGSSYVWQLFSQNPVVGYTKPLYSNTFSFNLDASVGSWTSTSNCCLGLGGAVPTIVKGICVSSSSSKSSSSSSKSSSSSSNSSHSSSKSSSSSSKSSSSSSHSSSSSSKSSSSSSSKSSSSSSSKSSSSSSKSSSSSSSKSSSSSSSKSSSSSSKSSSSSSKSSSGSSKSSSSSVSSSHSSRSSISSGSSILSGGCIFVSVSGTSVVNGRYTITGYEGRTPIYKNTGGSYYLRWSSTSSTTGFWYFTNTTAANTSTVYYFSNNVSAPLGTTPDGLTYLQGGSGAFPSPNVIICSSSSSSTSSSRSSSSSSKSSSRSSSSSS